MTQGRQKSDRRKKLEAHFGRTVTCPSRTAFRPLGDGRIPTAPRDLGAAGKDLWEMAIQTLTANKTLSSSDAAMLTTMCRAWELSLRAEKLLRKKPFDKNMRVAWKDYVNTFMTLASDFGLTPLSRSRIRLPEPTETTNTPTVPTRPDDE